MQHQFLKENGRLDEIGGTKVLFELLNQIPNLVYLVNRRFDSQSYHYQD